MRLRLSSSRQPYRRGGLKIGPRHAPSLLEPGAALEPVQVLALLLDPVITIAVNEGDGEDGWRTFTARERDEQADVLKPILRAEELASDEDAAIVAAGLLNKFEDPAGGEGEASGAAASDADPDPKASDATGMDAVDQGGAATASAAAADEAREPAGAAASDRKAAATVEQKPEGTVPPPVADKSTPAATKGAKPKAASRRQPRKAPAKEGTKQG